MGSIVSVLVPLVGPDFPWLPARWFEVADGVMSFGLLRLTYALIIAAGVRAVSARNGYSEWTTEAKDTVISVLMAVIVLASVGTMMGFLIGKFACITP